jgi:hypothetical protein
MGVTAARLEVHDTVSKSSGLALNPCEPGAIVDDEIGARVLSERKVDRVSDALQRDRDG